MQQTHETLLAAYQDKLKRAEGYLKEFKAEDDAEMVRCFARMVDDIREDIRLIS